MEVPRGMEPTGTNGRTRHIFQSFPLWWVGSRPVVVSRWMARNAVSCGHETKDRSVLFASVVRFPDRHDRNRSCGWFRCCRPPVLPVGCCIGFAVVMAQVRRPVPFRTRKLRPGRGDGTALERVWESSTPPHSTSGFPSSVTLREPPFFVFWFVFPAARGRLPIHNIQLNNMKILGRALRSQGSFCISGQIIAILANCPA